MSQFAGCYAGLRALVTGHTGFKGSWLTLWLQKLGARVSGLALNPPPGHSHWDAMHLPDVEDHRGDIRDAAFVERVVRASEPDIVFHLAAQPLVRPAYNDPVTTWATNVTGTANLLDACRKWPSARAIVVVTTDKVYANREWPWGYRENDALGGRDPYSASKAACEFVVDSYRNSFFTPGVQLATARGGNVVGGGDWSIDRLIPDVVRSVEQRVALRIRSPQATRPWQHVLECLGGYLLLGRHMLQGAGFDEAWNFGPAATDNRTVVDVLFLLKHQWPQVEWAVTDEVRPHEATLLYLDNSKARTRLNWDPVWELEQCIVRTADWYKAYCGNRRVLSTDQLDAFHSAALEQGRSWLL